jgi:3-carboxymuconate cyclase
MKDITKFIAVLLFIISIACSNKPGKNAELDMQNNSILLFAGTYSNQINGDTGIFIYEFDTLNANFKKITGATGIVNPSYLALSPKLNKVYSVSEGGINGNLVNDLEFNLADSSIHLVNSLKSEGEDPCFIATDNGNKILVTANYSGGSISIFSLKNGNLENLIRTISFQGSSVIASRQEKSHLHTIAFSPDNKYLFATDLGTDMIYRIKLNPAFFDTNLNPDIDTISIKPGSGPRHLAFGKNNEYLYLINELSGEINVFRYDNGDLSLHQTILADTSNAHGSADIHLTSDGKYLYASHRLYNDGISIFEVLEDGKIKSIGYAKTEKHPRNFVITPNDRYMLVACRDDNCIEIFEIDHNSGLLNNTGKKISIGSPVCLKFFIKQEQ